MKKFFIFLYFIILLATFNLALPFPQVGYELQSGLISVDPAPDAPTAEKRLWLWLHKYAPVIRAAGKKYQVPPIAIAGVIAWEGAQNSYVKRLSYGLLINSIFTKGLFLKSIGPGKVQAWGEGNAAIYLEGNPRYQPVLSALPPSVFPDVVERIIRLRDPVASIEYIAAIMNAYAYEAAQAGYNEAEFNLRLRPGVLATLFDGVKGYYLPDAGAAFKKRMQEMGKTPFMLNVVGRWVQSHQDYLFSAMAIGGKS